ncbi:MAG: hypothetical protein RLZZ618_1757 [Pseudomonadota bacterium]|jgi:hypothetical protein
MRSPNVGTIDRALRILLGLALIILMLTGIIGYWGLLGLIPLFTGMFSSCPVYSLFGISSRPRKE